MFQVKFKGRKKTRVPAPGIQTAEKSLSCGQVRLFL